MKAIIICDDEDVIAKVDAALASLAYDTIIYRWLLKALDNIEEIKPDLVVVSASDYPRHWKTLTQFIKSGIGGKIPDVILYVTESFSDAEKKKARRLGIKGIFASADESGISLFRSIVNAPTGGLALPPEDETDEAQDAPAAFESVSLAEQFARRESGTAVFTHPVTGVFVTGSIRRRSDGNAEFTADTPSLAQGISPGDRIEELSLRTGGVPTYCTASVVSAGNEIIMRPDGV